MGKRIYVANISFNATEQDVRDLFSEYAEVESVKIITDKYTGQSNLAGERVQGKAGDNCFGDQSLREGYRKSTENLEARTPEGRAF
jgi:hypothetical protein